MIETTELMTGVMLHICRDQRFKQGCLSVQLIRPMCREEAALNALIPAVLLRGSERYPDMRSITLALDELYGASVSTMVRRVGDYQTMGLYGGFMDDRFVLPGDQVLEPMMELMAQLLLRPWMENGMFSAEFVESEKKNLVATIETERNDKRAYAAGRLLRTMCRGDSFALPRLGEVEQVTETTPESAWQHYREILKKSQIELFYIGSASTERVAKIWRRALASLERDYEPLSAQTGFSGNNQSGQRVTERMEVTQAQLQMGFLTPVTSECADYAAMQVFNALFGAGMTSKLFMNIREKQSLCYSIGSAYYGAKGILTVGAGIDPEQAEMVQQQVMIQLEACCAGKVSQEELESARQSILSALRTVHDNPGAIENYYLSNVLRGVDLSPEMYAAAVRRVTVEQVAAVARMLELHTVYLLEGVEK